MRVAGLARCDAGNSNYHAVNLPVQGFSASVASRSRAAAVAFAAGVAAAWASAGAELVTPDNVHPGDVRFVGGAEQTDNVQKRPRRGPNLQTRANCHQIFG